MDSSIRHIVHTAFRTSRQATRSVRIPAPPRYHTATLRSIVLRPDGDGADQRGSQVQTYSSARKAIGKLAIVRAEPHYSHSNVFDTRAPQRLPSRPASTQTTSSVQERTKVSIEQYNRVADAYLDNVQHVMEELQEDREDVDVEFSVCLLAGT